MIDFNEFKEKEAPETEEEPHIYLTDEEGNEYPFDLLDIIPHEGEEYAVFFPADESDEDDGEDTDVVILKVIHNADDSVEFEGIEDDAVLDAVFNQFMENMRQAFEEDGEQGEDCGCGHCHE